MKNWLGDKFNWLLPGLIALLGLVYWDSFGSVFFQDDKVLLGLSQGPVLALIPNFPFRPVAIQIFYGLAYRLFGLNPWGYHFILFLAFAGSMVFVYKLGLLILKSRTQGLLATFFYAFNVSLFPNFYWIAVSYFSIGVMFFVGTIWFFLQEGKLNRILGYLFFLLALGSNELAILVPGILWLVSWYMGRQIKKLGGLILLDGLLLIWRYLVIGLPKYGQYSIKIDSQVLSTFRWYFLRVLNLPEGIRFSGNYLLIALLGIFIFMILLASWKKLNLRLAVLAMGWLILGALPFYFLPNHMSSYYLTIAMVGPALFFGDIFRSKKIIVVVCTVYLLMTLLGLGFIRQTHWIILKNTGPIGQFSSL